MNAPALHPDVAHLGFLLGTWAGTGHGIYPTIESFDYTEEATFTHVGKPFLAYTQRTRHADTGAPLHAEAGYLRPVGSDRGEFVVVQPSGIVEVHEVTIRATTLTMGTTSVQCTPTAKPVEGVRRVVDVDGDTMTYALDMAAVGRPMQRHLDATLVRGPATR